MSDLTRDLLLTIMIIMTNGVYLQLGGPELITVGIMALLAMAWTIPLMMEDG